MNLIEPPSFDPLVTIAQASFASGFVLQIIAILLLLICSGLISGSEAAFFSLSPKDKESIREQDDKSSKLVLQLLARPKSLLAIILVVNNFVNVGIVILSSSVVGQFIGSQGNETLRFVIEIFAITLLLLLLGEVIPKIYATKNAVSFARKMAIPLNLLSKTPPFSWIKKFLVSGSNLISKRAKRKGYKISSGELEAALALTKEDSTSDEEHKILEGIVKFGNTDVKQIMKPRIDVVALDSFSSFEKVMEVILDSGYSRIPVYKGTFDNILGILFIKDLLPHLNEASYSDWNELVRKPFFVPENKKIDDLLKEFQTKKVHMAVVVDEHGGSSGLITLEDVLEEIVGDITDEFDDVEVVYTKIDDNTFLFEGRTSLVDFYKVIDIDGKEFENNRGDAETLGGFIVEQGGKILKNNEFIIYDNIKLIVESSDKKRVKMVKAVLLKSIEG